MPGIQGVGYAVIIKKDQLKQHILKIRKEGFADYTITPAGDRELYTSIIYLEPFKDRNLRAFGYDMYSEPIRRKAMEYARDYDVATLSGKVVLVQETGKDLQPGTLMYVPIYTKTMPANTLTQRRAAIKGWVYTPYRMVDLMKGILGVRGKNDINNIHLRIYDNDLISESSLLFDSKIEDVKLHDKSAILSQTLPIDFNNKKWTLEFTQFNAQYSNYQSHLLIILISGFMISFLLFAIFFMFFNTRFRAQQIAEKLTSDLHESEKMFSLFMDHLPAVSFLKDSKGNTLFVNKFMDNAFGASKWIGKNMVEVFPNEIGKKFLDDDLRVLKSNYEKVEETMMQQDGKMHYFETQKFVIPRQGQEPFLGGISLDITDRKFSEEALKEERQRLSGIIKGTNVATWEWNVQTGETIFNERWAEIIGYTLEEISPVSIDTWLKLVHPDDLIKSEKLLNKHFQHELDFYEFETRMKHKNGSWVWVLDSGKVTSWTDDQKPLMMMGSHLDITERKLVEQELKDSQEQLRNFAIHLQKVREKERLSITLEIHDSLAQFLAALKIDMGMFKSRLMKRNKAPDLQDVIAEMDNFIGQTDNTIKTARKIMNGLRPEQLELLGFVEATEAHLQDFEAAHHIKCQFETTHAEPDIDSEYELVLFWVLQESLNNVLKHAMATLVTVQLSYHDDKLVLEITDNGVGFDKNSCNQQDSFGIISMKEQLKLIKGNFEINSTINKGTSVRVEIPL